MPYSVFTVTKVERGGSEQEAASGTFANPWRIHLESASDNMLEPEDLPLAPWS